MALLIDRVLASYSKTPQWFLPIISIYDDNKYKYSFINILYTIYTRSDWARKKFPIMKKLPNSDFRSYQGVFVNDLVKYESFKKL